MTPTTTYAFESATGGYTRFVSTVDPRTNLLFDPDMRAPRTDEFSIGIDREMGSRLAVSAAYMLKVGANFIGWNDIGGRYEAQTRTLPDGRVVPVFALVNSTADRRFLLTNPDDYSTTYNGLVLAAEKRRSSGWQAFGSYTFSSVSGLQVASGSTAAAPQVSTVGGPVLNPFGQDPNSLTNARGLLPNDRPHVFRLMGSVDVPKTGLAVAGNLQYYAGKHGRRRHRSDYLKARSASCSRRAVRAGCRRKPCSTCAFRGHSRSVAPAASSCSSTC